MFQNLFQRPCTIEKYRQAPLDGARLRYLHHLQDYGVRPRTLRKIASHQLGLTRLLDLREGDRVSVSQVEAAGRKWSRRVGRSSSCRSTSRRRAALFVGHGVRWLQFLGWLEESEEVRHPHAVEVATFAAQMRGERGLSEKTVHCYCAVADEFFDYLAIRDVALAAVKITDIDGAIAAKDARGNCSRTTIKLYAERLRAFFRFAEARGWCMPGISAAIMPLRVYPDEAIPAGPTREDIQRLLASTEGDRPVDKRDRAILMLFVAYGLRAGEVGGLQLDDLDWEEETLRVRCPKPGRTCLYPLSRGVGQAILRYIIEVRPSRAERSLFFTLRAPFRPLSGVALGKIVSRRFDRLGIVDGRRGPHSLRHAAAQHLLDEGMSMKVVGDFLGHRSLSSTAMYAKIDLNALREVADFDLGDLA